MQKITPFLWFNGNITQAVELYESVFQSDFSLLGSSQYTEAGPGPAGSLMSATFTIYGQEFIALNGGPEFKFSPAISFFIKCETQAEVDHLWQGLSAGGGGQHNCGWLNDKFGISWQVVPTVLGEMLSCGDPVKSSRVMAAMMKMHKLDIAGLEAAFGE